jgi:hypothetical protein
MPTCPSNLPRPTVKRIKNACKVFDRKYLLGTEVLELLLLRYRKNAEISHVLLKVLAINQLMKVRVENKHVESLAREIAGIRNIDVLLNKGDRSAVDLIAGFIGMPRHYSFATKYCSLHKPDAYPIYDSIVDKMLWCYSRKKDKKDKKDKFLSFKRKDLKDYKEFVGVVDSFLTFYNLKNSVTYRELDKFLWTLGGKIL